VGFGYPYGGLSLGFGYSSGWGGYAWAPVCVAYPYVGYYYSYPYPYLSAYDLYDCDFYGGYYVRFGYARRSYYSVCSGLGSHGCVGHHCHVCDCEEHGSHHYHVRDCPLCYPDGGGEIYRDVEVPAPTSLPSLPSLPLDETGGASESEVRPLPVPGAASEFVTRADSLPIAEDEAFFASLKPAQLSFAMGLVEMKHGNYDGANEDFYNATIEDPAHALLRIFLGTSLVSIGEYGYAAEYLRAGLSGWPEFARYVWDVTELFASTADYEAFMDSLEREARLDPVRADVLLSLGFLAFHGGRLGRAGEVFDALLASSADPRDQAIAQVYLERIRGGLEGGRATSGLEDSEFDTAAEADRSQAVGRFLGSLSLKDLPGLPLE
jgi:hypothetical protein